MPRAPFVVLEYAEGDTLREVIKRSPPTSACPAGLRVARVARKLDGHHPVEPGVVRPVHLAEAAGSQELDGLVASEYSAWEKPERERPGVAFSEQGGRRPFDEAPGLGIAVQKREDVLTQRITGAAGRVHKGTPLSGRQVQRSQEQLFDRSPDSPIGVFHASSPAVM